MLFHISFRNAIVFIRTLAKVFYGMIISYFYLDDSEKKLVNQRRGNYNRLGFALQLCTVRFLGTFLANPIDVPDVVVSYLAKQLEIKSTDDLSCYLDREPTKREHAGFIVILNICENPRQGCLRLL